MVQHFSYSITCCLACQQNASHPHRSCCLYSIEDVASAAYWLSKPIFSESMLVDLGETSLYLFAVSQSYLQLTTWLFACPLLVSLQRFNTRMRIKAIVCKNWSYSCQFIDVIVGREFSYWQVIYPVILCIANICLLVIFHHFISVFGLAVSLWMLC